MIDGYTEALDVAAPADAVWAVMSDVRSLPDVLSGMTVIAIEGPDTGLRVGLAWTQTRVIAGRTGSERLHVTKVDDGRSYVTEGGSHGFDYRTTWAVEPTGPDTCRVSCTFLGIPRTSLARLMLRLFGRFGGDASRAAMRIDLHDIARAATDAGQ